MPLVYSPLNGVPISALGMDGTPTSLKANSCIFFALQTTLMFGRRDLMPLVWAYSISSHVADAVRESREDVDVSDNDWDIMALVGMSKLISEYKLDANVSAEYGGEKVDMRVAFSEMAEVANILSKDKGTNDINDIVTKSGATPDARSIFSLITRFNYLGTTIAQAGYLIGSSDKEDIETYESLIVEIQSVGGVDFNGVPIRAALGFKNLKKRTDMYSVWNEMSNAMKAHFVHPVIESAAYKTPEERMECRWASGNVDKEVGVMRDNADSIPVRKAFETVSELMSQQEIPLRLIEKNMSSCIASIQLSSIVMKSFSAVTFMSEEDFEQFVMTEETVTLWDIIRKNGSPSEKHTRFSDTVEMDRVNTDVRLWGEKGEDVVYAVLLSDTMKDMMNVLSTMYGKVAVFWENGVFDYSTLTINDSTTALYSLPATKINRLKALLPVIVGRMQNCSAGDAGVVPFITQAIFGKAEWVNFVEIQIHSKLKMSQIKKVVRL